MKEIDIIMPCYYNNDIIRPCLESIIHQTVVNQLRVIMINDCSPNTTCKYQDLIQEYSKYVEILYLETEKHSGPGIARQLGLDNATNSWVWFQDDDDEVYDNTVFEKYLRLIQLYGGINKVALVSGQKADIFYHHPEQNRLSGCAGITQGTLYNTALLHERNIHFEPILSFKEEDTAFLTFSVCATIDKKQICCDIPAYRKKWTGDHKSVTSIVPGAVSIFNLLLAKTYAISYHLKYQVLDFNTPDASDYYVMIPTFIHNLTDFCQQYHETITEEMYSYMPFVIEQYFALLEYCKKHNITTFDITKKKNELQDLFRSDSWFGVINEQIVLNFPKQYINELDRLKQYVQGQN